MIEYLIAVDGGGSGTRVSIARCDGVEFGRGNAGPSALAHGIDQAWDAVLAAIDQAFGDAGMACPPREQMAIGLGLAGVHNKQWAAEFAGKNPGFGAMVLETDAFCTLLGAHQGQPGIIIAIGTGSVGEAWLPDGTRHEVGGWGFPSSDEASGAWLGMHAINHIQRVFDGRAASSDFALAVMAASGANRDALFTWLARANQTAYARLAPIVVEHAARDDVAQGFMRQAGSEIATLACALDCSAHLPIALCGGLAVAMHDYLPATLRDRLVKPHGDAVAGAQQLIRRYLSQNKSPINR